jgi:hypothetical protein
MLIGESGCPHEDKFRELCALAATGTLTAWERSELKQHLAQCEECREVLQQYQVLVSEGMGVLAAEGVVSDHAMWDERTTRQALLARVEAEEKVESRYQEQGISKNGFAKRVAANGLVRLAMAAGLLLAVGAGAYHLGLRSNVRSTPANVVTTEPAQVNQIENLSTDKKAADSLLVAQETRVAELSKESAAKDRELTTLREELKTVESKAKELVAENGQNQERLQALERQKQELVAQLQSSSQAADKDRAELAMLRSERDRTVLHVASLEGRINELTTTNKDQEARLKDTEQYLRSDRDIRELMGARKLHIADVFDVDGSSRTQRPFGRVFYTEGKSLIFYAFDLDKAPKVTNASFQVWGQHEAPQGERVFPMNLGILYMDSEANRRWVMRFDDPKQLAEIDAVFVTIEPRGGSPKPTSKPFLYALLRNEANHP